MLETIKKWPKVELHYHLDGGLRPDTIKEIASQLGMPLPPDEEAWRSALYVTDECPSLIEYLSKFQLPALCLQTAEHLKRAAYEAVEDAAQDNIKYIEIRFAPQLHTEGGLSLEDVVSSVVEGAKAGERDFGTIARIIPICLRNHDVARNWQVLELTKKWIGKGVVGIDLAGDEAGFPPQLHRSVFVAAKQSGIPITIHAGEAAGADSIRQAVTGLFAQRIGHGVRLAEDPELLELVKEKKIPLEMCLTSNIQTKAAPSWEDHPIRQYDELGIIVTVNTDNTTVSNTTLTQEYERLMRYCRFSFSDLQRIVLNALDASFAEAEVKEKLRAEFKAELGRFGSA